MEALATRLRRYWWVVALRGGLAVVASDLKARVQGNVLRVHVPRPAERGRQDIPVD